MSELTRIAGISEELESLHDQLQRLITQSPDAAAGSDLETLRRFKAALDDMRHLVWPWILGLEQRTPKNIANTMSLYHMERIRDMVSNLQELENSKGEARLRLFWNEIERKLRRCA